MQIKVEIRGADAVKAHLSGMGRQVAYAASRALNATAKKVAAAMPGEMDKELDRPTQFTRRGVRVIRYSNKGSLTAIVGFAPIQAKYMEFQVAGGERRPGPKGIKLPSGITLNSYGNIPRGVINALKQAAGGSLGLGATVERRLGVSGNRRKGAAPVQLFYGIPRGKGWEKAPLGIWRRIPGNPGKLIPIVVFPQKTARYRARFDLPGKAAKIVAREWDREFSAALAAALSTAR
jgi:hypothetical protein